MERKAKYSTIANVINDDYWKPMKMVLAPSLIWPSLKVANNNDG